MSNLLIMPNNYSCFDDLPQGLKERVRAISEPNEQEWVNQSIPALHGRSFIETINEEDGYSKVCIYLNKVEGYLS